MKIHKLVLAGTILIAVVAICLSTHVFVKADSVAVPFNTPTQQMLLHGGFKLIGNNIITCNPAATPASGIYPSECTAAKNYTSTTPGAQRNNGQLMVNIDLDGDPATYNSSRARLTIPSGSVVKSARVFWAQRSNNAANNTLDNTMKFKKDGGSYQTVSDPNPQTESSQPVDHTEFSADVTGLVQQAGAGDYWGADIQTGDLNTNDKSGGWALYVVYENAAEPQRLVSLFDGNVFEDAQGAGTTATLSGFRPKGQAGGARIGMLLWDGDLGPQTLGGTPNDKLFINSQPYVPAGTGNSDRTATDTFVSEITDENENIITSPSRLPGDKNTFGQDIFNIDASSYISQNDTSMTVEARAGFATDDFFWIDMFAVQVDVQEPTVSLVKTASSAPANVTAGDTIDYTASLTTQDAPIINARIEDTIPLGTSYVPGSLRVLQDDGAPSNVGAKTDQAADDTANFDSANPHKVVFRVGAGADATSGGALQPGQTARVTFSVKVDSAKLANGQTCAATYSPSYFNHGLGDGTRAADRDGKQSTVDNISLGYYQGGTASDPFDYPASPANSNLVTKNALCGGLLANTGQSQHQQLLTAGALLMSSAALFGMAMRQRKKYVHYRA